MDIYDWTGWEAESDLGNDNDREGVYFLTITENGEELAVIILRVSNGFPLDGPVAKEKEREAQKIVDALNAVRNE